ncbi:hypothetical protein [Planosporangium mesophilum]|uniref:Uncharacterized protein n=1 Tax=Planosporangium mesophilum TaxID=689768 RepID=A0A8J3TAQ9_9ACTN|nr:hypothetical protein [Planosporangium mesophilum]NJC82673.1 hypothetical protein [Planosporangium mesophilum]GII21821.1 hypothetical protein Pme01_14180 [Planosporangium mesophilum]
MNRAVAVGPQGEPAWPTSRSVSEPPDQILSSRLSPWITNAALRAPLGDRATSLVATVKKLWKRP